MTIPITLENLASLENETTALSVINTNSATITSTFGSALDTGGDQMEGNLDMNSNRVLNLPTPASNFEPIRFIDAASLGQGGTITLNPLPSGGTVGQVLAKNSSTNFDTSWQTQGNLPTGGNTGQVLVKTSNSNFVTGWENAVTSVGITAPADLTVSNSPVTTTGNLGLAWTSNPTGTGAMVRQTSPTLTTPVIAQISNAGNTMIVPSANDTFVGRNTIDTLTNKTIGTSQLSGQIPATNMPILNGDVTTAGGTLTTAISANAVTNGQMAQMSAYTLKGNSTGSLANPTDISIPALAQKVSPVAADMIMLVDSAASNALKMATVSSVASAGSVASIDSLTGAFTTSNGITSTGNSLQLTAARRTLPTRQVFTSSSGTYTTPANCLQLKVTLVGGGGGGGSASGGGSGSTGGNSTFSTFTAGAGTAGGSGSSFAGGGSGGSASGGSVNINGTSGGNAFALGAGVGVIWGGTGGASPLFGTTQPPSIPAPANSGSGGGGGGGGTNSGSSAGGGGGGGGALCIGYINAPASTYAYSVGAGGGGSGAGIQGANGAAGIIIVEEFYNS